MHFYGLISKLVVLLREEIHRSNVQLLQDKKRKKNSPREDNLSDALSSITLFTPSDTVAHCNSEDLVTVSEAILNRVRNYSVSMRI